LSSGAEAVVGFDADVATVEAAFERANSQSLNFLPLVGDMANPSPDQGWAQNERGGLARRAKPDALLALALVHHLAIGRNIPLDQVIEWIIGLAPVGIIEFVPNRIPW